MDVGDLEGLDGDDDDGFVDDVVVLDVLAQRQRHGAFARGEADGRAGGAVDRRAHGAEVLDEVLEAAVGLRAFGGDQ